MSPRSPDHPWSDRDTALWRACEVAFDLARGVVPPPHQDVRSTFRPQLADDEVFWAAGPFTLSESRRAALDAMAPRWTEVDRGILYLSSLGFHLATDRGVWSWTWASITAAQMQAAGAVHLLGQGAQGQTSWLLTSDWAELLFVTWAFACHARHAQLQTGEWLPAGWLEWNGTQQWRTRLATPAFLT